MKTLFYKKGFTPPLSFSKFFKHAQGAKGNLVSGFTHAKAGFTHAKAGFSLLEVLIAVSLFSALILGIFGLHGTYIRLSRQNNENIKAIFLLEETLEVSRFFRDTGWDSEGLNLPLDTPLYLTFSGTEWQTQLPPIFIDGKYERTLTLSSVYRDGEDDIVLSGGALDTGTLKATAEVSWFRGSATTTKSIEAYFGEFVE